jgi:hypothetical protein
VGDDRGVGSLARIVSSVHLVNLEACGLELCTHLADGPEIRGGDGVRERHNGVALEEADEETAARCNASSELAQDRCQLIGGKVDDGVPSKDCNCVPVWDIEIAKLPDSEWDRRKSCFRSHDKFLNLIDALRLDTELPEEIRPLPRTASRTDYRPPQVARPLGDKPLIRFVRIRHRSEQRRVLLSSIGIRLSNHIASHGIESKRIPVAGSQTPLPRDFGASANWSRICLRKRPMIATSWAISCVGAPHPHALLGCLGAIH